jgi:hypothetical protein
VDPDSGARRREETAIGFLKRQDKQCFFFPRKKRNSIPIKE